MSGLNAGLQDCVFFFCFFFQDDQVGIITDQLVGVDLSALCFHAQVGSIENRQLLINSLIDKQVIVFLILQIRLMNEFSMIWSNWSESFTLVRYPSKYPNCVRTSPSTDGKFYLL